MAVPKDPREIETADPFRSLFPIDPAVRDLVASSIRANGYDPGKPILAWRDAFGEHGRTVVIDGHTRLAVALDLGLDAVLATMRRFDSVDAAIAAAIGEQAQRRNLNPSQLAIHVLTMLDRFDDGFRGQGARNDLYGRSAKQLGEMIGVTSRTIERARQLIAFGDDDLLAQVKAGDIGLKTAIERARRDEDLAPEPEPAVEPEPEPESEPIVEHANRGHDLPKGKPDPQDGDVIDEAKGGLTDFADVFWGAVEELRDLNGQTTGDAQALRLAGYLSDVLGYFGIDPADDDATVQFQIVEAAWDDNGTPHPAPWEVTA
jgi:hypothetical protein